MLAVSVGVLMCGGVVPAGGEGVLSGEERGAGWGEGVLSGGKGFWLKGKGCWGPLLRSNM